MQAEDGMAGSTLTCPRCGGPATEQGWCETCQKRIGPAPVVRFEERSSSPHPRKWKVKRRFLHLTAALMSLVIPGAGQIYKGRVKVGLAWLVIVVAAYALVGFPGVIIHLMCVVSAGSAARIRRRAFISDRFSWRRSTG